MWWSKLHILIDKIKSVNMFEIYLSIHNVKCIVVHWIDYERKKEKNQKILSIRSVQSIKKG